MSLLLGPFFSCCPPTPLYHFPVLATNLSHGPLLGRQQPIAIQSMDPSFAAWGRWWVMGLCVLTAQSGDAHSLHMHHLFPVT